MPSHLVAARRALISVSDKLRAADFARSLHERGIEIVSTGGTAELLRERGVPHKLVEEITGSPEMLDGRVKTLHPLVHGPILADRSKPAHLGTLERLDAPPIDIVVVNLYPFERTVSRSDVTEAAAVEQIDIGGPTLLRAAAKNFASVLVVSHPNQYAEVETELERFDGYTSLTTRRRMALAAFTRVSRYDTAISDYLSGQVDATEPSGVSKHRAAAAPGMTSMLQIRAARTAELRYGENPHQAAAVYADHFVAPASLTGATQLSGKPMSYNNYLDAAAGLNAVVDLLRFDGESAGACVVKHTNPCGLALAPDAARAVEAALLGDPMAAFGGVLTMNRVCDEAAADAILENAGFLEVIAAATFAGAAAHRLAAKWPNARLIDLGAINPTVSSSPALRSIPGGVLMQELDAATPQPRDWTLASGVPQSESRLRAAAVVTAAVKHLTSNAVAIGGPGLAIDRQGEVRELGEDVLMLYGAGAGQMDRVAACRLAIEKAGPRARAAIASSDAFFPFPDGPAMLIEAGVNLIVQPGGSKRDAETFELCQERGVTCMLSGVRHFRH